MAVDAPKAWERSVFACVAETTTGVLGTLNAAAGAYNAYNALVEEDSESDERPGQSSYAPLAPVSGALGADVTLTTDLFGSESGGSSPGWVSTLMKSCGFTDASGVVTPLTGQSQTLSMAVFRDGIVKKAAGCMGGFTMKFVYGKPAKISWKFRGKWANDTDVALIAPTYPTTVPPIFSGATISFTPSGSSALTTLKISEMEIDVQNELYLRPDAGDTGNSINTGYHAAFIVAQKILIKADPEAVSVATHSWSQTRRANTPYALSMVVGGTAGNQCTIAAPKMYLLPAPKDKNRGKVYAHDLQWLCARSVAAGDDQISFTF